MENIIVDNTISHQCSRCGECCGLFIPFTEKELHIINDYVKEHNIKPVNRQNKITGDFNANCCFLDKNKCLIYEVRPYVCRNFKCDRKDWKQKRDQYEKRAKYNSTLNKTIVATFDDKIYGDYYPIINYILDCCKNSDGKVESEVFINMIKKLNREDLLEHFSATTENGEVVKGIDL